MYKCLFEWCGHQNRDNKQIALMALDSFLRQVEELEREGGGGGGGGGGSRDFMPPNSGDRVVWTGNAAADTCIKPFVVT